jgi:hypothetical protein
MEKRETKPESRKRYEPPAIVEVHVDPHKELLQGTNCGVGSGDPSPNCAQNPFV